MHRLSRPELATKRRCSRRHTPASVHTVNRRCRRHTHPERPRQHPRRITAGQDVRHGSEHRLLMHWRNAATLPRPAPAAATTDQSRPNMMQQSITTQGK